MTMCKPEPKPASDNSTNPQPPFASDSTRDLPTEPANSTRDLPEQSDGMDESARLSEIKDDLRENSTRDSELAFESAARVLGNARSAYERARINCFVPPAHRHQLDALTNEWDCTLTEVVRRLLADSLSRIMQADQVPSE